MFATVISMFKNKEIRNRILYTLAMLFVFRFGAAIIVPGVDTSQLMKGVNTGSFLDMINLLGGGMIQQLSIFSLGVGPYITASIILQLLSMDIIPHLTELSKQGQSGRKQIDRYTRYLAVVLGFIQAFTLMKALNSQYGIIANDTLSNYLYIATILTAGSMFLLWIGDRISTKGIGSGVSMLIFAGIVARMPAEFVSVFEQMVDTSSSSAMFNGILEFSLYVLVYLVIIVTVIFMQTAVRKIPIQYTSSSVQRQKRDMTYLPLKINSASVIPVIFANALMVAPATIAGLLGAGDIANTIQTYTDLTKPIGLTIYIVLTILFTFFYTNLTVDPEKIADNLGKSGTYIPGIRPGTETKEYIKKVLNRITVLGAVWLAAIASLPYFIVMFTNLPRSMGLGGTGIIIVVGVAMETVKGLKGQLTQKSYRGFIQH